MGKFFYRFCFGCVDFLLCFICHRQKYTVSDVGNNVSLFQYEMSLRSKESRATMLSKVKSISALLGDKQLMNGELVNCKPEDFPWALLDRALVNTMLEMLTAKRLTPNTIRLYLACFRGIAQEAQLAGFIISDAYIALKAVKPAPGYRVGADRAPAVRDVHSMMDKLLDGFYSFDKAIEQLTGAKTPN